LKKILIVDDEKVVHICVEINLGKDPRLILQSAYTSEGALLSMENEKYDLALIDLRLGSESGLSLARTIKKKWPEIKIIAMSGMSDEEISDACIQAGVSVLINKIDLQANIKRTIENLLWPQSDG